ncbi:hypothetical protein ACFWIN_19945 [Streptomyces sp. NPDC127049]|uniref:hypothetical protein n=1 Tax=Streptomyces sp. NPDC127049 TaxID=3347118 RepID=UPI00365B23F3
METGAVRRVGRGPVWGAVPAVVAVLVVAVSGCADADAPGPSAGSGSGSAVSSGITPGPGASSSAVSPPVASSTGASSTAASSSGAPGTPAASGTGAPSASTAGTPSATAAEADPAEPRAGAVLVEVVVNGGFAGVTNQLVVHEDGSWTVRSKDRETRSGRMGASALARLRAALEDPAYARVPGRPSGPPIADGFQYFVTYDHRLVVAGDGERPAALQRVFDALPEGGPPTSP